MPNYLILTVLAVSVYVKKFSVPFLLSVAKFLSRNLQTFIIFEYFLQKNRPGNVLGMTTSIENLKIREISVISMSLSSVTPRLPPPRIIRSGIIFLSEIPYPRRHEVVWGSGWGTEWGILAVPLDSYVNVI